MALGATSERCATSDELRKCGVRQVKLEAHTRNHTIRINGFKFSGYVFVHDTRIVCHYLDRISTVQLGSVVVLIQCVKSILIGRCLSFSLSQTGFHQIMLVVRARGINRESVVISCTFNVSTSV